MKSVNLGFINGLGANTGGLPHYQQILIQYAINILVAIIVIVLGKIVAQVSSNALVKILQRREVDLTIVEFVRLLIKCIIILFAIIAALGSVGVETSSLVAILGTAGLAIAFALKDSLSNFAAGILLVTFRPFRINEYIEVSGIAGIVDSIHFFSTVLRSSDNKTITIPNGTLIKGNIINYTRQKQRRIDLSVGISYDADIDQVKTVLLKLIQKDPRIVLNPSPAIRLKELAASSLDFTVRVWVANSDYWPVYFDLLENIKKELDVHKIAIPYPQMDIHFYPAENSSNLSSSSK